MAAGPLYCISAHAQQLLQDAMRCCSLAYGLHIIVIIGRAPKALAGAARLCQLPAAHHAAHGALACMFAFAFCLLLAGHAPPGHGRSDALACSQPASAGGECKAFY